MVGSKWAKSQNGPRVKMGYYCLPPESVKLTMNSKKETNDRVKMGQESRWARSQYGLLLFTPDRVELAVNSKEETLAGSKSAKSQDGPRVKIGQDGLLLLTP